MKEKETIERVMKTLRGMKEFDKVKFVILFGSYAYGTPNKMSDIDICIYYDGDAKERFELRKSLSYSNNVDIQMFQDLPLYVRKEVLRGKLIYYQDLNFVYDNASETAKAFEDFKRYYYDYIEMGLERIK